MTAAPLRETAPPPGRGRRALNRLRYVPLIVLMLCVVAATLVGWRERSDDERDRADAAAPPAPSLPAACAPPVDQGLAIQPWRDTRLRPASRKAADAAVAREHPGYVKGRDGWLFFTDVQAEDLSQSLGRERLQSSEIEEWNAYLSEMKAAATRHGGQFYVMVAPAKWDVYPEKMPTWAEKLRGTNSLDLLMSKHPELPFIDVREPLRSAKEPTYSPLNSHWTNYGGYVAWDAATKCLRAADPDNDQLRAPKLSSVEKIDDLNEFAADGVELPDQPARTEPVYSRPHPDTAVTDLDSGDRVEIGADEVVDMTLLPVETRTPGAQTDKTLLVLRDSTGSALSPLWSASFARTVQYQHPVGDMGADVDVAALVDEHRPDITIFTMTERYLVFGPPTGSTKP